MFLVASLLLLQNQGRFYNPWNSLKKLKKSKSFLLTNSSSCSFWRVVSLIYDSCCRIEVNDALTTLFAEATPEQCGYFYGERKWSWPNHCIIWSQIPQNTGNIAHYLRCDQFSPSHQMEALDCSCDDPQGWSRLNWINGISWRFAVHDSLERFHVSDEGNSIDFQFALKYCSGGLSGWRDHYFSLDVKTRAPEDCARTSWEMLRIPLGDGCVSGTRIS